MHDKLINEEGVYWSGSIDKIVTIALQNLGHKLCLHFQVESDRTEELLQNFTIKSESSGHNNQICLIDFYDNKKNFIGDICLKYAFEQERKEDLQIELNILNILQTNNILCPSIVDANFSHKNPSYILMETIKGRCINKQIINLEEARGILDVIQSHESVLLDNLLILQSSVDISYLDREIDFEKKLSDFLINFAPNFIARSSFDFLNSILNHSAVIKKRSIVTDRSAENIFIDENNQISMIDFSTIRIGTQFDNWIQFIDDPRATFSCTKEELITTLFKKNGLLENELVSFYASSIYTNLLQGIFTYRKSPRLGIDYINNVNNSFKKLMNKKCVLIDIIH